MMIIGIEICKMQIGNFDIDTSKTNQQIMLLPNHLLPISDH